MQFRCRLLLYMFDFCLALLLLIPNAGSGCFSRHSMQYGIHKLLRRNVVRLHEPFPLTNSSNLLSLQHPGQAHHECPDLTRRIWCIDLCHLIGCSSVLLSQNGLLLPAVVMHHAHRLLRSWYLATKCTLYWSNNMI